MLWVPIVGSPLGDHHLSIQRSDRRRLNPIAPPVRKRKKEGEVFHLNAGPVAGRWRHPSRWRRGLDIPALAGRLLVSFGLMPIKFDEETLEANRFSSYHLAMIPPVGLVVREVRTGSIDEAEWGKPDPAIEELSSDQDRTVHGEDSRTGHVHLEMKRNPAWLNSRITIGLRPGTTTLWAAVGLLTCGLLWAVHSEIPRLFGQSPWENRHPLAMQIAAAVLLVGPTFAASWTLRVNDPTLIRNMLGGAQTLLLSTAILSVAAALVLAEIEPFGWDALQATQWYASACYVLAIPLVTGWLQARSTMWWTYRGLLSSTERNVFATALLSGLAYLAVRPLADLPMLPAAMLLFAGLGLTAVAGNRTSVDLGKNNRWAAAVPGVGALVALGLAGRELRFFEGAVERHDAFLYGGRLIALVGVVAAVWFGFLCIRAFVESVARDSGDPRRNPRQGAEETHDFQTSNA